MVIIPFKYHSCQVIYTGRYEFESHQRSVPNGVDFCFAFVLTSATAAGDYVHGQRD